MTIVSMAVAVRRLHDVGRSGWWYGSSLIFIFVWFIWFTIECFNVAMNLNLSPNATADMVSNAILMELIGKILITYIPLMIYGVMLLVFYCMDSKPGTNDDPCSVFGKMCFPVNEFYPYAVEDRNDNGCQHQNRCGCEKGCK